MIDNNLEDKMLITVIATGCGEEDDTKTTAKVVVDKPAAEAAPGMPEDEFSDIMNIVNNNNNKKTSAPAQSFPNFTF